MTPSPTISSLSSVSASGNGGGGGAGSASSYHQHNHNHAPQSYREHHHHHHGHGSQRRRNNSSRSKRRIKNVVTMSIAVNSIIVIVVVVTTIRSIVIPFYFLSNQQSQHANDGWNPYTPSRTTTTRTTTTTTSSSPSFSSGRQPDGYFNSFPVYLQQQNDSNDNDFHSTIHCVGETHNDNNDESLSWMYRSCEYTYLCLDVHPTTAETVVSAKHTDFFVVSSPVERDMQYQRKINHAVSSPSYISTELSGTAATNHNNNGNNQTISTPMVALSGINPRWVGSKPHQGPHKVRWAPKVVSQLPPTYYRLDDDVVLVPFHSFAGHNVGHLLWDDFWPIFSILQLFGYMEDKEEDTDNGRKQKQFRPLLLRVDTLKKLYSSCEIQPRNKDQCQRNFEKFLPLMGIHPTTFTTLSDMTLTLTKEPINGGGGDSDNNNNNNSVLPAYPICVKHAVAGIGMLTDHGLADHGWDITTTSMSTTDTTTTTTTTTTKSSSSPSPLLSPKNIPHNIGRGKYYYDFRNFMLQNMNLPIKPPQSSTTSSSSTVEFRILFNVNSTRDMQRRVNFEQQEQALRTAFPTTEILSVDMKQMTLMEQLTLVSQCSKHTIFVSTNGGGSMTSFFLPRDSTVIFYYNENAGYDYQQHELTGGPAMLDWDLFNNLSYLRVHWLPIGAKHMGLGSEGFMNTDEAIDTLTYLIRHEMDVVINKML